MQGKIIAVGASGVGKSGLCLQFIYGMCPQRFDPTIEDSYIKCADVDGRPCILNILDTGGQEKYSCLRKGYMDEGEAFLFVYSVTDRESLEELKTFKELVQELVQDWQVPICLVGNKMDLEGERQVTRAEGMALQKEWLEEATRLGSKSNIADVVFFETSAMDGTNVKEAFHALCRLSPTFKNVGTRATEVLAVEDPKTDPMECHEMPACEQPEGDAEIEAEVKENPGAPAGMNIFRQRAAQRAKAQAAQQGQ